MTPKAPKTATYPFTRYRPERVDTGGGFSETLTAPLTIWSEIPISDEKAEPEIDMNEDVQVSDIIEYEEFLS